MHDELTREDIRKMQEELDYRRLELHPGILEEVKRTRAFGDLSENYEYKAAKQAQRENMSRMRYLEGMIKSARVISDRSGEDEVGLFEGGLTYMFGVWRPSENSIMNDNQGGFNAPSRYTIWYRIHKLAYGSGWNGTYEDFAAYDAINRAP